MPTSGPLLSLSPSLSPPLPPSLSHTLSPPSLSLSLQGCVHFDLKAENLLCDLRDLVRPIVKVRGAHSLGGVAW